MVKSESLKNIFKEYLLDIEVEDMKQGCYTLTLKKPIHLVTKFKTIANKLNKFKLIDNDLRTNHVHIIEQ